MHQVTLVHYSLEKVGNLIREMHHYNASHGANADRGRLIIAMLPSGHNHWAAGLQKRNFERAKMWQHRLLSPEAEVIELRHDNERHISCRL